MSLAESLSPVAASSFCVLD